LNGEHSKKCQYRNGIKLGNNKGIDSRNNTEIEDITVKFKRKSSDMALEKIWLMPIKIWQTVRDDMAAKYP